MDERWSTAQSTARFFKVLNSADPALIHRLTVLVDEYEYELANYYVIPRGVIQGERYEAPNTKMEIAEALLEMLGIPLWVEEPERLPWREEHDPKGYVYLMTSAGGNSKIGATKNHPKNRKSNLQKGHPHKMALEHYFPAANMIDAERTLHERYASVHVVGDWFSLSEKQIEEIKAITEM
jgi:hypothetical protein